MGGGRWLKQRLPSQTNWTQGLGEDAYLLLIDQCAQVKPAISTYTQEEISCMALEHPFTDGLQHHHHHPVSLCLEELRKAT